MHRASRQAARPARAGSAAASAAASRERALGGLTLLLRRRVGVGRGQASLAGVRQGALRRLERGAGRSLGGGGRGRLGGVRIGAGGGVADAGGLGLERRHPLRREAGDLGGRLAGPRLGVGATLGDGSQGGEVTGAGGREDGLEGRFGGGGFPRGDRGVAAGREGQPAEAGQLERRRTRAGDMRAGLERPAVDRDPVGDARQVGNRDGDGAGVHAGAGPVEGGGCLPCRADVRARCRGGGGLGRGGRDLAGERRRAGQPVAERGGTGGGLVAAGGAFRRVERQSRGGLRGARRRGGGGRGRLPGLGRGEGTGGRVADRAGGGGVLLGRGAAASGPVVALERLRGGRLFERGSALGVAGRVEPAAVDARGLGGPLGRGQSDGTVTGGGGVDDAGQLLPQPGAFGQRGCELGAVGVEPGEFLRSSSASRRRRPRNRLPRLAGCGGDVAELRLAAGGDRVETLAAGDGVELAGDRGQQVAPDLLQPLLLGLLGRIAALGLQREHALADPEQLGRAAPGDPGGDPAFGLVVLGEDAAGRQLGDAGEGARQPAFGDAVAGAVELHLRRDLGCAADVGAQPAGLGAAGPGGHEDERLQRLEEGRLAGLVRGADQVEAVAEPVEAGGGAGEAADVGQADRAELHAASPAKA